MDTSIIKLDGTNMDIDLTTPPDKISWKQDSCLWNIVEDTKNYKCAVKNISICSYFCSLDYLDNILCCYPKENPLKGSE
jgi:hypothetical protein